MNEQQLAPVADILIRSYFDAAGFSRTFKDEHGQPPTGAAKIHYMLSATQTRVMSDERYDLSPEFAEAGRVLFLDRKTGVQYLLRSASTVTIEQGKRQRDALFDSSEYLRSDVVMLVHHFHAQGLDLSVSGTASTRGRRRLEVTGVPSYVATWLYVPADAEPFDQEESDPFKELGGLDESEEGEGG